MVFAFVFQKNGVLKHAFKGRGPQEEVVICFSWLGSSDADVQKLRLFLAIWRLPSGPGLVFRSLTFKKSGVLRVHC